MTGTATYPSDVTFPGLAHATLVQSTIDRVAITSQRTAFTLTTSTEHLGPGTITRGGTSRSRWRVSPKSYEASIEPTVEGLFNTSVGLNRVAESQRARLGYGRTQRTWPVVAALACLRS